MKRKHFYYNCIVCILICTIFISFAGCKSEEVITNKTNTKTINNETCNTTTKENDVCTTTNITSQIIQEPTKPEITKISLEQIKSTQNGTVEMKGNFTDEAVQLKASLESNLNSYNKKISVVAYSLDGTKSLAYNSENTYFSACTIKAGYILSVCKYIEENNISPLETMTYTANKYYHGGSGKIRYSKDGTTYTLEELINMCLSISDNVAYEMLSAKFGHEYYNNMIKSFGCDSLVLKDIWGYNVKPSDYVIVWYEINNYFKTNTQMSTILKTACTNTPFNYATKTLKYDYSHKSGDCFGKLASYNDAAIVWTDNPYIIVIFTNSEGTSYDSDIVNKTSEIVNKIFR